MSQQPNSNESLLSLSIAAANAQPIPLSSSNPTVSKHHRRLSSTGKTRRRLSDARDAAARPTSTAAAALSLASLSLSTSPPSVPHPISTSLGSDTLATTEHSSSTTTLKLEPADASTNGNTMDPGTSAPAAEPIPIANGKNKKRGMDHKCETCSKIYRHPSCLIKHRWEHTPHWREASKYVLSKHQQVQLLEAAAILSHLSPSSSSLPEDRSLWPSFLSGGSLPPPENAIFGSHSPNPFNDNHASASYSSPRQTNSVPNYYRSAASSYPNNDAAGGPRLHDYPLPNSNGAGGAVTQVRPGLVGVPNADDTSPYTSLPLTSDKIGVASKPISVPSTQVPSHGADTSSASPGQISSLSRSDSVGSGSGSRSRSQSASISDEEMSSFMDQDKPWRGFAGRRFKGLVDLDEESEWNNDYGRKTREKPRLSHGPADEEWDGMEMDMEMD